MDVISGPGNQRFSEYGKNTGWCRSIMRPGGFALTDRALQLCGFKAGDRVVDIGCGFGATVEYLRRCHGLEAVGIDPSAASLEQGLRLNPFPPISTGFAEELPFGPGMLDGVLAECSLSVIAGKEKALAEFCRVLRPGGKMVITDVYARNADGLDSIRGIPLPFGMTDIMTQDKLTAMVGRQGFYLTKWEDHSHTLKAYLFQTIMGDDSSKLGGRCEGEGTSSWQECICVLKRASLGYFLLVALKAV